MSSKTSVAMANGKKKLNLKEKLTDDTLDLSVCSLETVPVKEIAEFSKVRKLNLSYNLLVSLPDDFIKLQNIRELDLSKNKLKSLPKNFGSLANLRNLDLLSNELTTLPSSFCELKSLQWLDLKDNPLIEPLKKAAGDCFNEAQCKKCAANVIVYMKQVAADEERQRQVDLKRKREEQSRKEAEEKEKAEHTRAQKKLEREHRRLANEQRRQQIDVDDDHKENGAAAKTNGIQRQNGAKKSKSSGRSFVMSTLMFVLVVAVTLALAGLLLSSYCDGGNKELRKSLRQQAWLTSSLGVVDVNVCPHVIRYRPLIRSYISKPFEFF